MSVRFVIGRAGYGKTTHCLTEICDELKRQPMGDPLIWLVPEQASFQAEYSILQHAQLAGSIRAEVLGFRRLAHRIMQQVKGTTRTYIDDAGKVMILLKVVHRVAGQLQFYRAEAISDGLLEQLGDLFDEWKRNGIHTAHFASLINAGVDESESAISAEGSDDTTDATVRPDFARHALQSKLADLVLIFQAYEQELQQHYVDAEDDLLLLTSIVCKSEHLRQARIWVDGFHGFTPLELDVLAQLAMHCRQLTITLCLDREYRLGEPVDDLHLFHRPATTYLQLRALCHRFQIAVESTLNLNIPAKNTHSVVSRRAKTSALQHLEAHFEQIPIAPYQGSDDGSIGIYAAVNRRVEVEAVAAEMVRMAREEGVRWREMAVLVRQLDDYLPHVDDCFRTFGIPFFSDQRRTVTDHPLIEFIRASLQAVHRYWRYEDLFRAIKTGFFMPHHAEAEQQHSLRLAFDELENTVIAAGLVRSRWLKDELWEKPISWNGTKPDRERWRMIRKARRLVLQPLLGLKHALDQAADVRTAVQAIYDYLCDLQIPDKCSALGERLQSDGQLDAAQENARIWTALVHLFDQNVEILGDTPFRTASWIQTFDRSLEALKIGFVPPSLDQVLIGTVDRTRAGDVRKLFVLGVNEGVMPARVSERGLFSDREREQLIAADVPLSPGSTRMMLDETFLIYTAVAKSSEQLWLSFCLGSESGKGLLPSSLIAQWKQMFPQIKQQLIDLDYANMEPVQWSQFIQHPKQALELWIQQRDTARSLRQSLNILPDWELRAARLEGSASFRNQTLALTAELAADIYGHPLKATVSRFELYSACAFAHFARHGLRLKERATFELQAMHIGNLYHQVLERVIRDCNDQQVRLYALNTEQMTERVQSALIESVGAVQHSILTSSPEHLYTLEKLSRVVMKTLLGMAAHERLSSFEIKQLEWSFDRQTDRLQVSGRVDRIDIAEDESGRKWLRIIDYKSGAKKPELAKLYHGLSLQLAAYVHLAAETAESWLGQPAEVAGAFYFHIHDKMNALDHPPTAEQLQKTKRTQYKMSGLIVDNLEVLGMMDATLKQPSTSSEVLSIRTVKDGSVHGSDKRHLLSTEQWEQLRAFVEHKMLEIGKAILAGDTSISPYRMKKQTPCEYCAFRSVCQFDRTIPGQTYRYLPALDREEAIARMKADMSSNLA